MCIGKSDNEKFMRRKWKAVDYMRRLLLDGKLSDQQAIEATTDKFSLNASIRNDYRIYKALWNLIGA